MTTHPVFNKVEDPKSLDLPRQLYGPEEELFCLQYKNTNRWDSDDPSHSDYKQKGIDLWLMAINWVPEHGVYRVHGGFVLVPQSYTVFGQVSILLLMTADMWEIGEILLPCGLNKQIMAKQIAMVIEQCKSFEFLYSQKPPA